MRILCLVPLLAALCWLALAQAQPVDFAGLEQNRQVTSGPAGDLSTSGISFHNSSSTATVPAGQGMQFTMGDREQRVSARLPNGVVLILSRGEATFQAAGTLPVSASASVDGYARAEGSARLRVNSQAIVDDALSQLGGLPPLPVGPPSIDASVQANASANVHGDLRVDNVQASAEAVKRTQGVLVGVPVTGGFSFFAGAKKVQEYLVVAVQGFDYHYNYSAQVDASASGTVQGRPVGSASYHRQWSGSGDGHVSTPGLGARAEWEYTVAVVGVGYRGEKGGFHVLVDLAWSRPEVDPQGYVDVGPLQQLRMPGAVRDVEVGGDFQAGGFSAGANVKLFTFAGYAAGAKVDMFVCQQLKSVSVGLAYRGQARGLMADQSAALEVGFMASDDVKVTAIAGVRLLSSYVPGFKTSAGTEFGRDVSGTFGDSMTGPHSSADTSGSWAAGVHARGDVSVNQPATWRHELYYAPGLRVDFLSRRLSVQGGPILDSRGHVVGGQGGASWELVKDRMDLGVGASRIRDTTGAGLNLNVRF